MFYIDQIEVKRECLINGKRVHYDVCSSTPLLPGKSPKDIYPKDRYKYIGKGYTYYINDTENISKNLHYFFIKTTK